MPLHLTTDDITVSGGAEGDVLTQQADGSYAPDAPAGGGGSSELPWLIDLNVFATAASNVNWNTVSAGLNGRVYEASKTNSGSLNDEISWPVVLAAGTWTIEVMHRRSTNVGICSVQLGGVEQGTIDGYAASASNNVRASVSGISIASTGKKTLTLKMTSKNASSSAYHFDLSYVRLLRTA